MNISTKTLYLTAIALWISHFFVDVMIGFWPVYKTVSKIDLAYAGFISAGCAFAGEGMQILFGPLSDRGYRKFLIAAGLMATGASTFLAYSQNLFILFFLFLITCIGSGAFHPSAVSLIGQLSSNRKGLLITFFGAGGAFGLACSQLIFTNVYFSFEGHTSYLAMPIFALGLYLFFSSLPNSKKSPQTKPVNVSLFITFFKRKELRNLYFTQVCNQTLVWGFIFLLPDVLTYREYPSWVSLGGAHMMFVLGSAFMMIPGGHLADKYSCRIVLFCSFLLGLLFFYSFLFFPWMPIPVLFANLFALGAVLGVANPVAVALGNRLVPENPGMISAFLMGLVWCVSEGLGQGGGGLLTKLFDDDAPARALAIVGTTFFGALICAFRLPQEVPHATVTELQKN